MNYKKKVNVYQYTCLREREREITFKTQQNTQVVNKNKNSIFKQLCFKANSNSIAVYGVTFSCLICTQKFNQYTCTCRRSLYSLRACCIINECNELNIGENIISSLEVLLQGIIMNTFFRTFFSSFVLKYKQFH